MLKKIINWFKNVFKSDNKNKKKPSKDNYPMWSYFLN